MKLLRYGFKCGLKISVHGSESGNTLLNEFIAAHGFKLVSMCDGINPYFKGLFVRPTFQLNEVFVIVLMHGDTYIGVWYDGNCSQEWFNVLNSCAI